MFALLALAALVVVSAWITSSFLRRGGKGIVAQRGTSTGADVGALIDQPRVHVISVLMYGPDRVQLRFVPVNRDVAESTNPPEFEIIVDLTKDEFGFELLHEWKQAGTPIAIVMRRDTRIVRLRSLDDLQPLTLRRADA